MDGPAGARKEELEASKFEYNASFSLVSQLTANKGAPARLLELPDAVICCLGATVTYLRDFRLDHVLYLSGNISQFTTRSQEMLLNATTLRNLEVFREVTSGDARGSLFWVLDHTSTGFGKRMLRSWVSHPLTG